MLATTSCLISKMACKWLVLIIIFSLIIYYKWGIDSPKIIYNLGKCIRFDLGLIPRHELNI